MQPCISRTLPYRYCAVRVTVLEVAPPSAPQRNPATSVGAAGVIYVHKCDSEFQDSGSGWYHHSPVHLRWPEASHAHLLRFAEYSDGHQAAKAHHKGLQIESACHYNRRIPISRLKRTDHEK